MNPDRHIYLTTAVLAVVVASAINVLTPRYAFVESTVHPAGNVSQRSADAGLPEVPSPQNVEVSARAPGAPQRAGNSL